MVGLRMGTASCVPAGAPLVGAGDGLFPIAAALSSLHLPRHCSACFTPCVQPTSVVACRGLCRGVVIYCSSFCCSLDLQLHSDSGECLLLAICTLSAGCEESRFVPAESGLAAISFHHDVWQGRTSFHSLGGTCDLRTALRLLAHHEAQHNASRFLESRKKDDSCRLGSLMSNRTALLQSFNGPARKMANLRPCDAPSASSETEIDDDAQELARDLREAALLLCFVRSLRAQSATVEAGKLMTREDEIVLAEEVICQVLTNGVQVVVDKLEQPRFILAESGSSLVTVSLGTAVYGPLFSWFNHSCRPNASYRFVCGDPWTYENSVPLELEVKVVPDMDTDDVVEAWRREFWQVPLPRIATTAINQRALRSIQLEGVMVLG